MTEEYDLNTTHMGSILDGINPLLNPLGLLLMQIVIILTLSRILAIILSKFKQPSVIAEVIAGILLGPS
jgi:hypothetical protein